MLRGTSAAVDGRHACTPCTKETPHLAGLNTTKVRETWKPQEIVNQVRLANKQPVSAGHVHWNMKSLMRSTELGSALGRDLMPKRRWCRRANGSIPHHRRSRN